MSSMNPVFTSPVVVANYLHSLNSDISPIRLQKSLYFLFAYYGGVYFTSDEEGKSEGVNQAKTLFVVEFEAWKYGPVIREIYRMQKSGELGNPADIDESIQILSNYEEEKKFIDDLYVQMNSVSDFSLVERSHQDEVWEKTYNLDSQRKIMDNTLIINEYKEKYL